ncbi:guanine nucleotide exchange factor DBS-like isoform X5 [Apostichopus japonicus]|uniref:guanine nucleotide exchange factor DBS-like isoform X5 n=1 Tax=Stichopus japonicus TaxID=307972 RepID=UPI003AB30976
MASVAVWLVEALQDLSSYYFIVVSSPDCLPHGQCSSLYDSFTIMEFPITDVAKSLQSRIAYIAGGKTEEGYPIVILPNCPNLASIPDEEFVKLMTYLVRVPSYYKGLEVESRLDCKKGFAIVIDRRDDNWAGLKSTLIRIAQGYFPGVIQCVFVIKPKGFLQKQLADYRFKNFKDDFKFTVILLDSVQELHARIDPSQLTTELGGTLDFDLTGWIEDRMAIERFANNCKERTTTVQNFLRECKHMELPNDVESATILLMQHRKRHMDLKDDMKSAIKYGRTLLGCLKRPFEGDASYNPDENSVPAALDRLITDLETTLSAFEEKWAGYESRLVMCIKVRQFEVEFKEVLAVIEEQSKVLQKEIDLGGSREEAERMLKEEEELKEQIKIKLTEVWRVKSEGEQILGDYEQDELVESIRPKCEELGNRTNEINTELDRRKKIMERSIELFERIERVRQWCKTGTTLLDSQDISQCETKEKAQEYIKALESCLTEASDLQLSDPREFRNMFEDILTSRLKNADKAEENVRSVVTCMEDVRGMFDKQKESLNEIIVRCERPPPPVVTPVVEPEIPKQKSPKSSVTSFTPIKLASPSLTPPASEGRPVSPFRNKKGKKNRYKREERTIEIVRADVPDMGCHSSDSDFQDEDTSTSSFKRKQIMKELIDTEKIYVKELESVLTGYIQEMTNPNLQSVIPETLREKEDILFANWEEIFEFHKRTFLVELETYKLTPTLVGKCFLERKDDFDQLYCVYCQNKPRSELLRRDIGNNQFFQECQQALNHKLPISAYLLKPVQRITKYQLLLKEMMKYSADEEGSEDLQAATDCMMTVLKYVNDSMHQVAITGFQGNLGEQGKLLMQGSLFIWVENKKSRHTLKDIRQKKMQRHVFLYEKMILFCKKRRDFKDKTCYAFKHSIKVPTLNITEHVKGDIRKFELWLAGKAEIFTFQASSESDKHSWVKAFRQAQLQNNEEASQGTKQTTRLEPSISAENVANANGINNNITTVPSPTASESSSSAGYSSNNPSINSEQSFNEEEPDDGWETEDDFYASDDEVLDGKEDGNVQEQALTKQYVVIADYNKVDNTELSINEGEVVDVQRVGKEGWWFVSSPQSCQTGWVPGGYLAPMSPHELPHSSYFGVEEFV